VIRGQGQLIYADALRVAGRLDESLVAAQAAIELLADFPLDQPDAYIASVRTLLAMQNYTAAGDELAVLEGIDLSRPSKVAIVHQLRLEHSLRTGNSARAATAFDDYMGSSRTLNEFTNSRQADHYSEKLRSQRATLELKLAREAQALLSAEAATQKAQASELRMREASSRERRNLQIGGITFLALAAIGFVLLNSRRRYEKQLQAELSERNASLSALVDAKSKDLVETVTEQAGLKQALAERRHMEAIGQIAGHVAHDFNNTLQVVSSANDLLESLAETDSHRKVLNASNRSIQSGSSTVRQLLAYSRNQQLESKVFSIAEYLDGNTNLFRSAIGEVNQLRVQNNAADARVNLDGGQLTASLINLLRNASDAMASPGEIVLRAEQGSGFVGDNSLPQVVPQLRLQVIDRGRGMSEEQAGRALEPYYTTKTAETGTGLGLSSVYGFVIQSGGSITIDSQLGDGTVVTLCFPQFEGLMPEPKAVRQIDPILSDARVLVVEDNELIAETLQAMLTHEGAEVVWVSSAGSAQTALAGSTTFDLILSDVNIPGDMNGFDLARWAQDHHPEVRVGMMSGYGPTMNEYSDIPVLAKPFTRQQLLAYLEERVTLSAGATVIYSE